MNFEEGTAVRNTMRGRDGIFVSLINDALALVDYGHGPEKTSVTFLSLTERQQKAADRQAKQAKLAAAREECECTQEALRLQNKAAKLAATPVEVLKRTDPEALQMLADYYRNNRGRMECSCAPRHVEKLANSLSSNSSLTEVEAIDYINIVTEASMCPKYDIMMADNLPSDLALRLSVLVWRQQDGVKTHAKLGEIEINSRQLCEWLMKEHNFLPKKWR